jgi:hypothetical protein
MVHGPLLEPCNGYGLPMCLVESLVVGMGTWSFDSFVKTLGILLRGRSRNLRL